VRLLLRVSICVLVCLSVSLTLIDVASAEQTAVSQSALMKIIRFDDKENIEQAERYLLATALSTHPTEATLKHLLVCTSFLLLLYYYYYYYYYYY